MKEILKEGDDWERGSRVKASKKLSPQETETLLKQMDLQLIAIRLPVHVIEQLKEIAKKEGLKYQPYVRRLLIQHVDQKVESLEERIEKLELEMAQIKKTG